MGEKAWYEGDSDPLSGFSKLDSDGQVVRSYRGQCVNVGSDNEHEPDQIGNNRASTADGPAKARKVIDRCVELAAHDPAEIMEECESQDELLGLPKGTTLELFLNSISSTH